MDEWLLKLSIIPVRMGRHSASKVLEAQLGLKQRMEKEVFCLQSPKGGRCVPPGRDALLP